MKKAPQGAFFMGVRKSLGSQNTMSDSRHTSKAGVSYG